MALDIVLSFIGTCKVICLSKGQSSPYDQLSRILPLLGEKKEQHQQQQAHLSENWILFILIHLSWIEKRKKRKKTKHAHTCVSFQNFHLSLSQCSTILFKNYWSCHSNQVKVAIMDSVSVMPLSLWTSDRQSFLRLMPVFPSAPKHGNYTSFYVPLVQACDSNSEPISAAVLLRITAWQRCVTMCMLNMFGDNTCSCAIFHIHDGMMFIPVDIIPECFSVLIF